MSGKTDQVKGRVKEATGVLVGNKGLEREGKLDRAVGKAKQKVGELADAIEEKSDDAIRAVKSKIKR